MNTKQVPSGTIERTGQVPSALSHRPPSRRDGSQGSGHSPLATPPTVETVGLFSAPPKGARSAAFRPLHRAPFPGARENPQRHAQCAKRKRRKRRAPFAHATIPVSRYETVGWATFDRPYRDFGIRALPSVNMRSSTASSRREETEHTTRGACVGTTVNTYGRQPLRPMSARHPERFFDQAPTGRDRFPGRSRAVCGRRCRASAPHLSCRDKDAHADPRRATGRVRVRR